MPSLQFNLFFLFSTTILVLNISKVLRHINLYSFKALNTATWKMKNSHFYFVLYVFLNMLVEATGLNFTAQFYIFWHRVILG